MATISFITFSAGDTTSHTNVNSNFGRINTYISDKIPNVDLANQYSDVIIGPFTIDSIGANSAHHVIRMKPPLMNGTLNPHRAMVSFDTGSGDAELDIKLSGTTILVAPLTSTVSNAVATVDSFSTETIGANQTLSFHVIESGGANPINGITVCLWCKSKHVQE